MAKGHSGRSSKDYRKLQTMKKDLLVLKRELVPDEKDKAQDLEMKGFDDFQRKKHELNTKLSDIRVVKKQARKLTLNVDRLNEMRKKLGDDGRDDLTIRLASENSGELRDAAEMFEELRRLHEKDEKKKKKKFSEKDLADRRELVVLIGKEIVNLTNENARNKRIETEEEADMRARVETRKKEKDERLRLAREKRKANRKGKKGDAIDEDDFKDVGPRSEQEQAFEQQVQANVDEQNKILVTISQGLDELKNLANEANKQLTVQGAMLEQVDQQMDATITQFKAANKRLKSILEESGGMSRWCPMIICAVFLLALVGYIFGIV